MGPELENKGGVSHRHQPLHTTTPTAKPVFTHCANEVKHLPTLEAQLVGSCSSVVTESPDCPGGVKERQDGGTGTQLFPDRTVGPCLFIQHSLISEDVG